MQHPGTLSLSSKRKKKKKRKKPEYLCSEVGDEVETLSSSRGNAAQILHNLTCCVFYMDFTQMQVKMFKDPKICHCQQTLLSQLCSSLLHFPLAHCTGCDIITPFCKAMQKFRGHSINKCLPPDPLRICCSFLKHFIYSFLLLFFTISKQTRSCQTINHTERNEKIVRR